MEAIHYCLLKAADSIAYCSHQDPLKISHIIAVDGVGTGSATDIYIHSPTTDETFGDQVGAESFIGIYICTFLQLLDIA